MNPKQPENNIDVYLTSLIEYLRVLWEEDVDVKDTYTNDNFKMNAMLFCTIIDVPTCGNLLEYKFKGHKMCLICEYDTGSHQLQN